MRIRKRRWSDFEASWTGMLVMFLKDGKSTADREVSLLLLVKDDVPTRILLYG